MYIILRNKWKFNIVDKWEDNKWIYLKGNCSNLLPIETTICLENTIKNRKRIFN